MTVCICGSGALGHVIAGYLAAKGKAEVNLLSSNGIKLDYADLAVDLYRYGFPGIRANVRLKWGQDFCRLTKSDDDSEQ